MTDKVLQGAELLGTVRRQRT